MILYLTPDNPTPSWGIGVIYHHVKALNELGYKAYIVHQNQGFKLLWLNMDVPVKYTYEISNGSINEKDVLVVPEVMANDEFANKWNGKKILFIQASGWIFEKLPINKTHKQLGFSSVMVIMPHMIPIVEKFIELPVFMVPPMVADYFFDEPINRKREKSIVMYPKFNQIDFSIVNGLLRRKTGNNKFKKAIGIDWRIKLLQGLTHRQVAATFDTATFFISLNTFEALNTSVVEAMARGCIVFCYEGFGPRDFLKDGINAFVFGNNEPYQLVEKVYDVLDNPEKYNEQLKSIQNNALITAHEYTYDKMKQQLAKSLHHLTGF